MTINAVSYPTSITQPDVRLDLDLQGIILDVRLSDAMGDEAMQPWLGRPWGETVGLGASQVRRLLDEALATGVSAFGQVTQRFPSGRELPIEYTAIRLGDSAGLVAIGKNLVAVATLQSRLLAAQHAREQEYWKLREAETRYRLLFDASNEAMVLLQADTLRILELNPAAIRAFGVGPGEEFAAELSDGEQDRFGAMLAQARGQGRVPGMIVHLGAAKTPWSLRCSLMQGELGIVFLLQLAQTTRQPVAVPRRATLSLDSLVARLSDAFVVIDQEGVVCQVNPAFLDLIQASSEGAVLGEKLANWLHHPGSDVAVIVGIIDRHRVVRRLSTTIYGRFGAGVAVEVSAVGSSDLKPLYVGVLLRNVERRPASEQGLEAMAALAGPADQRGTDRGTMAAELGRTPLLKLVRDATDVIERDYIAAALEQAGGNRSAAAELLGLSRQTLYMKLSRYAPDGDMPAASGRTA